MFSFLKPGAKNNSETWLLAGLGNPGEKYSGHRHNIGFMALDKIADGPFPFPPFRAKFQGQLSEAKIDGRKIILLKPQTYMNNSGQSVGQAAKFYKIPPEQIVVFHDELDLAPGAVRIKKGGGNAGHNGLKSIQAHLGTPDFWRVRLGIGRPPQKGQAAGYVLSDFAKADQAWLDDLLAAVAKHYPLLWEENPNAYEKSLNQNVINSMQADTKVKKNGV